MTYSSKKKTCSNTRFVLQRGGPRPERNPVTALFYVLQNIVFADSTILTRKNVNTQGNIEGGVHRGDLFVDDDGSIYVMSITTEWQNAPKGDEGNWIKIRIN